MHYLDIIAFIVVPFLFLIPLLTAWSFGGWVCRKIGDGLIGFGMNMIIVFWGLCASCAAVSYFITVLQSYWEV